MPDSEAKLAVAAAELRKARERLALLQDAETEAREGEAEQVRKAAADIRASKITASKKHLALFGDAATAFVPALSEAAKQYRLMLKHGEAAALASPIRLRVSRDSLICQILKVHLRKARCEDVVSQISQKVPNILDQIDSCFEKAGNGVDVGQILVVEPYKKCSPSKPTKDFIKNRGIDDEHEHTGTRAVTCGLW